MKKEAIRVSTAIPAAPTTLYYAWLSSEQHGAMTGTTAKIDPTVGAKYTAANGFITGKLVILDLGRRLVMSWRTSDFPRDAPDSKVEVHLEAIGGSTRLTLIQTEIPEGLGEKCRALWNDTYFTPMRNFFSKFLPDPRNPPPPRKPLPPPEDEDEDEAPPPKKGSLKERLAAKAAARKAAAATAKAGSGKKPLPPVKVPAPTKPAPKAPAKPAPKPAKPAPKKPAPKPAKPAPKKPAPKPAKPAPKKPAPKKPAPKKASGAAGKKKK